MPDWTVKKRPPRKPPSDSSDRLILEVPKGGNLDEILRLMVEALKGGNNAEALNAINNLTNLVKESFMGLKEDVETLRGKFDNLESAALAVADDIAALKDELKEANERANIDLSPHIARADQIEAGMRAAVGSAPGSDPDAQPDGSETDDGTGGGTEGASARR